ncbi:MAG TPA: hypothetical protein PLU23_01200 [Anaerolineaceae bacterium]|jgi:hypothetical protein|nr:hypothetical protein [Anaerolineaceae bacterium]
MTEEQSNPTKKTTKKCNCFLIIIIIFLLLVIGLLLFERWFIPVASRIMCGGELFAEYPSPNGKIIASVYEFNCGVTTSFTTYISLRPSERDWDPYKEDSVFSTESYPDWLDLRITWLDDNNLEVRYKDTQPEHLNYTTSYGLNDTIIHIDYIQDCN